jgi:hypothetical protein
MVHALDDGLVYAAVYNVKVRLGGFSLAIHLVGNLDRRSLQAIIFCRKH